jgi:hypothetical protein
MHPGLSSRDYPHLITRHAALIFTQQTAQLNGRGEVRPGTCSASLKINRFGPKPIISSIPCAMLKPRSLHLFPVPG